MTVESDTITLPAYWSSALINGDYSSFSLDDDDGEHESACVDQVVAELAADGWSVVSDVEDCEPYFSHYFHHVHPDPGEGVTGGDVLNYVILRTNPSA